MSGYSNSRKLLAGLVLVIAGTLGLVRLRRDPDTGPSLAPAQPRDGDESVEARPDDGAQSRTEPAPSHVGGPGPGGASDTRQGQGAPPGQDRVLEVTHRSPVFDSMKLQESLRDLVLAGRHQEAFSQIRELLSRSEVSPDDEILAIFGLRMIPLLVLRCDDPTVRQGSLSLLQASLGDLSRPNLVASAIACFAGLEVRLTGMVTPKGEDRTECFIIGTGYPAAEPLVPEATLQLDPALLPVGVIERLVGDVLSTPIEPGGFAMFESACQLAASTGSTDALRAATVRLVENADGPQSVRQSAGILTEAVGRAIDAGTIAPESMAWYLGTIERENRGEVRAEFLTLLPLGFDRQAETRLAIREVEHEDGRAGEGFRILFAYAGKGDAEVLGYLESRFELATAEEWISIILGAREAGAIGFLDGFRTRVEATPPGVLRDLALRDLNDWQQEMGDR